MYIELLSICRSLAILSQLLFYAHAIYDNKCNLPAWVLLGARLHILIVVQQVSTYMFED